LEILFPSKPTLEVKWSLINQYVKKQSGHGTSTFNGNSVNLKPLHYNVALHHRENMDILLILHELM
jgi:hypothetical protein